MEKQARGQEAAGSVAPATKLPAANAAMRLKNAAPPFIIRRPGKRKQHPGTLVD